MKWHIACVAALVSTCVMGASDDLVSIVNRGDADALLQRVGHGSIPDEVNSQGQLPLAAAGAVTAEPAFHVSKGNAPITELLLKFGGNLDVEDASGASARAYAVKENQSIKKLIERWDLEGAAAFEDAPGTWTRHYHETHNTPFYHNVKTGESRFMVPPSCAWIKSAVDGHPIYINQVTYQSRAYWYNYATEETSKDTPAELPSELVTELTLEGGSYFYNTASKQASWEDPAEHTWREVVDHNGRKFWYHPKTMQSVWSRPQEHAWRIVPSDEHPGTLYYFNEASGAASWEKPEAIAWERSQFNAHMDAITL